MFTINIIGKLTCSEYYRKWRVYILYNFSISDKIRFLIISNKKLIKLLEQEVN